jgi:hypothetical protein
MVVFEIIIQCRRGTANGITSMLPSSSFNIKKNKNVLLKSKEIKKGRENAAHLDNFFSVIHKVFRRKNVTV